MSYAVVAAGRREFASLRRALSVVVLLDAILLWSVLLASLLQCYSGEDSLLFIAQMSHLFTVLLGTVAVIHTRHAHGVLRLLFVFYLLGFVGDLVSLIVRLVMAYGVNVRVEPFRRRALLVYAMLSLLMALDSAFGAYLCDQIRDRTTPVVTLQSNNNGSGNTINDHNIGSPPMMLSSSSSSFGNGIGPGQSQIMMPASARLPEMGSPLPQQMTRNSILQQQQTPNMITSTRLGY